MLLLSNNVTVTPETGALVDELVAVPLSVDEQDARVGVIKASDVVAWLKVCVVFERVAEPSAYAVVNWLGTTGSGPSVVGQGAVIVTGLMHSSA